MYKATFLLKFRKDLEPEYVLSEWRGSHGQLALTLPGLRRYVQNHWTGAPPHYAQLYDASVDLWFDDETAFAKAFSGPEGEAMVKDDLRLFDRSQDPAFIGGLVDEHVMRWEPGADEHRA
ncbi:MAG: EthD family reductase [Phycisphaerales bacterium]|nr:EthD family reductase [Hyphomonadaceae bacterium]